MTLKNSVKVVRNEKVNPSPRSFFGVPMEVVRMYGGKAIEKTRRKHLEELRLKGWGV